MQHILRTLGYACCLFLLACSEGAEKVEVENPLADQIKAMEKAKAVEETLQKSFEQQNRSIDQQSQ